MLVLIRYWLYSVSLLLISKPLFANSLTTHLSEALPKKVNLKEEPVKKIFEEFIFSYVSMFAANPLSFFPYEKNFSINPKKNAKYIMGHMCQKPLENICNSHHRWIKKTIDAKAKQVGLNWKYSTKKIKEQFDDYNKNIKLAAISLQKVSQTSYQSLIDDLQQQLPLDFESFSLQKDLQGQTVQDYRQQLLQTANNINLRLILTPVILGIIEGHTLTVEDSDIINAVTWATKFMRKQLLYHTAHLLLTQDSNILSKISEQEANELKNPHFAIEHNPYMIHRQVTFTSIATNHSWLKTNLNNLKKTIPLVNQYSNHDGNIAYALLHEQFQIAVWLLAEKGEQQTSNELEQLVSSQLFTKDNLTNITSLGGGFTETRLSFFKFNIKGVYKPKSSLIRNPIVTLANIANYKKEVAAYIVDRAINLNMVPLTTKMQLQDYRLGSNQYYIENANRARDMLTYNGKEPTKFTSSRGRATKSPNILFFDWLIGNQDRNVDNYLILDNGRMIMIDHGYTFLRVGYRTLVKDTPFENMVPNTTMIERIKQIAKDPSLLIDNLTPWLKMKKINKLVKRIKAFVHWLEARPAT